MFNFKNKQINDFRFIGEFDKPKLSSKKTLIVIVGILVLLIFMYIYKVVSPVFLNLMESKAKSIAMSVTNKAIKEKLKDVKYTDLIYIEKDNDGKIRMLKANTYTMNQLSNEISLYIEDQLNNMEDVYVLIPIGTILGNKLLMNFGPKIKIKLLPTSNFSTQFKSEFISEGINQTVHKLYIQVESSITIITPLINKTASYNNTILVNEVVIVGDVPQSYYNLTGIDENLQNTSLNIID